MIISQSVLTKRQLDVFLALDQNIFINQAYNLNQTKIYTSFDWITEIRYIFAVKNILIRNIFYLQIYSYFQKYGIVTKVYLILKSPFCFAKNFDTYFLM